jgi:hypothetical protein
MFLVVTRNRKTLLRLCSPERSRCTDYIIPAAVQTCVLRLTWTILCSGSYLGSRQHNLKFHISSYGQKIPRFNENINFILYWLKSSSLKPFLRSWSLLHHLIHCFIKKIHYNTFYTPKTVSSQLYFPLRFSDQNSVCVWRSSLTWNTSFPPEPSSFHQPSNISSRLIIKEHLAICTHGDGRGNVDGDLTDITLASL